MSTTSPATSTSLRKSKRYSKAPSASAEPPAAATRRSAKLSTAASWSSFSNVARPTLSGSSRRATWTEQSAADTGANDLPDLPPARLPLPKFANEDEEAEYWGTHSIAEIWDQLEPVRPFKLPPSQVRQIRERHLRRKQAAAALLDPTQLAAAKRIAKRKSIPYETQLLLWIAEGIRRDSRRRD